EFPFSFLADQQPVVAVEGIDPALFQSAQQAVLQEMGSTLVEMHPALLIHECLKQSKFRVRQYGSRCCSGCAHMFSRPRLILKPEFPLRAIAARGLPYATHEAEAPRASPLTAGLLFFVFSADSRLPGANSLFMSRSTTK